MKLSFGKFLWTLPQEILGYLHSRVWLTLPKGTISGSEEIEKQYGIKVCIVDDHAHSRHWLLKHFSGVSLGRWVCLTTYNDIWMVYHEAGHKVDSDKLGWFYLPVIGVCSVFFNLWDRLFHKNWSDIQSQEWYYNRWTEARADRNAGFYRDYSSGSMVCEFLDKGIKNS
jgi:hypothetical protein